MDHSESRGGRRGGPQLFVIVASMGSAEQLDEGLNRLLPAARAFGAQVLVVGASTPNRVYDLIRAHSGIRFIMTPPGLSRSDLLSAGAAETSAGVVVLTDDASLARGDWASLLALRLGREPDESPGMQSVVPA